LRAGVFRNWATPNYLETIHFKYEKTYYRYFAVFPSRGRHAEFLRVGQGSHRVNNDHASDNGDATSGHADDDPNDTLLKQQLRFVSKGGTLGARPLFYFCSAGADLLGLFAHHLAIGRNYK
jgi:hypothetical protein